MRIINKIIKRGMALLLSVSLTITLIPETALRVHAADKIATIKVAGLPVPFNSIGDINRKLKESEPEYTIDMTTDWGTGSSDDMLVIPSGKKVTLNMNGFMFDRGKNQDTGTGSLISVEDGGILTVNGGGVIESHTVDVYPNNGSIDREEKTIKGGVIAGAYVWDGGGITLYGHNTLTLNNVTVTGCRTREDGAGICVKGEETTVNLTNSTVTGNRTEDEGGGIYGSRNEGITINLDNSHVDGNYAGADGGGIALDGEKCYIRGRGKKASTVSDNICAEHGGGIYLWNDGQSVSNLTLENNRANHGGAIFTLEEQIELSNLTIRNNWAKVAGGGIYIVNDANTISGCVITDNSDGVYVEDDVDVDFRIIGNTIIKDNGHEKNGVYLKLNLRLKDGSSFFSFNPGANADVHMCYDPDPDVYYEITHLNKDCRKYLTPDNPDFVVTYNFKGSRRNYYVKKSKLEECQDVVGKPLDRDVEQVTVKVSDAAPKTAGTVSAGGEKIDASLDSTNYELIRGYMHHEKTDSGSVDTDMVFYYSDGFFYGDSDRPQDEYNDHLATTSWELAFAGTYLRGFADNYEYKHAGARQFMADIGCPDQNIYVNDSMVEVPGTDTIGCTIGSKELRYGDGTPTGDILVPITIRGGGYENEWASNVTLGSPDERDGEAQGFSEAADEVMRSVEYYLDKYSLRDELEEGRIRFWISGFSRAGATANLTAKRLVEKYAAKDSEKTNAVFAYPCEPPKGGTDLAQKLRGDNYYCIHNIVNVCDVVPYVAPEEMGFKRYGVDHYIPGTEAGKIIITQTDVTRSGRDDIKKVTTYADNTYLTTKKDTPKVLQGSNELYEEYDKRRDEMIDHLQAVDSTMIFDDYFMASALYIRLDKYITDGVPFYVGPVNLNYNTSLAENFLPDFFCFIQREDTIKDRNAYVKDTITLSDEYTSNTIQQTARQLLSTHQIDGFSLDTFMKVKDELGTGTLIHFWWSVLGEWGESSDEKKLDWFLTFKNAMEKAGVFDNLPSDQKQDLTKNSLAIFNLLLHIVDTDWYDNPKNLFPKMRWDIYQGTNTPDRTLMYLMTMVLNAETLLLNHYPEVDIAWARTYDSYYDNEADMKEYKVEWDSKNTPVPDSPSAYTDADDSSDGELYTKLTSGTEENLLVNSKRIYLEVGNIGDAKAGEDNTVGESIFYDLEDITDEDSPKKLETNQIYRGGIDLQPGSKKGSSARYKITAYARSYGANSSSVTYNITLKNGKHDVTVMKDKTYGIVYPYNEGDTVSLTAVDKPDSQFTGWKVTDSDNTDVTALLLEGGAESNKTISFKMPMAGKTQGDYTWADDYELTIMPNYIPKIKKVTVSNLDAPVTGGMLDDKAVFSFDNGKADSIELPVSWSYLNDDGTRTIQSILDSNGEAYKDTEYILTVTIPKNEAENIVFADSLEAECSVAETINITKNNSDGSVTIEITFPKTDDTEDGKVRPTELITLNIMAYDQNKQQYISDYDTEYEDKEYKVLQGDNILVSAPDVENMVLTGWELTGADLNEADISDLEIKGAEKTIQISIPEELTSDELSINAIYSAVVNEVNASIDELVPGEPMPEAGDECLKVKISNLYEVAPENVELSWSPADSKVKNLTAYTAVIKLKPDEDGFIRVRPDGTDGDYKKYNVNDIIYADTIKVTINGEAATYDTAAMSLSRTFDPINYTLKSIKPVENMPVLPFETDVAGALQKTTKIITNDGTELDAVIEWGEPEKTSGTDPDDQTTWAVTGIVQLPEYVDNTDEISLEVSTSVTVSGRPSASMPTASVSSGSFIANQVITLQTTTEGGTIYYTTDGSDPEVGGKIYEGEEIFFSRNDYPDGLTIRAITKKDGLKTSVEAKYTYEFASDVDIPKGTTLPYTGEEQVGVSNSSFYTLTAESGGGAKIDSNGNAVATDSGEYTVTAKINDGFAWKTYELTADETLDSEKEYYQKTKESYVMVVPDSDSSPVEQGLYELKRTTEDQSISFTICSHKLKKVEKKDATCNEEGSLREHYVCEICGHHFEDENAKKEIPSEDVVIPIDKNAHSISYAEETLPTCEKNGLKAHYECSICGAMFEDEAGNKSIAEADITIPATGHDWGEWEETTPATLTETGVETRVCKNDKSHKETRTIPVKGSDPDQKADDGTSVGPGASAACADKAITGMENDDSPAGSVYSILQFRSTKQTKKAITLKWKKPKGTSVVIIYGNKCGKKNKMTKLVTSTGKKQKITKVAGKKLKKGTMYKFILVALDEDGNVISTSKVIHVATKGGKITNHKAVKSQLKKGKKWKNIRTVTVKTGKSKTIRGTGVKQSKKLKYKKHVAIRYESSNSSIATVSSKGVIKGKKKGTCYVYAYSQNGIAKKIKVKVK